MIDITAFGFKSGAFKLLPTDDLVTHWAGMPETRRKLLGIIKSVLPTYLGQSEFVILCSPLGGGKTHALRHFAHKIQEDGYGYAFFVSKVRLEAKTTFADLFHVIVDENKDMLPGLIDHLTDAIEEERRIWRESNEHKEKSRDELSKEIIRAKISATSGELVDNLLNIGSADVNALVNLLTNKANAGGDYSAAKTLSALIAIMTANLGSGPCYNAVYLFLDEVEDFLGASPAMLDQFFRTLRELLNSTANSCCATVLSFTEQAAVLEVAIPPYLVERLTRPIWEFDHLDDEAAKIFIVEYLKSTRVEDYQPKQPFYPFVEDSIDFIIERVGQIVPRLLIRRMWQIFVYAMQEEAISPGDEITRDIAEEVSSKAGL